MISVSLTLNELLSFRSQGNTVPLYTELITDFETPLSVYRKLSQGERNSFLFESVVGDEVVGRYSIMGGNPKKMFIFHSGVAEIFERTFDGGLSCFPKHASFTSTSEEYTDPLLLLEHELSAYRVVSVDGLPRFSGGLVGYFTYENARYFEPKLQKSVIFGRPDPVAVPEAVFYLVDHLVVFDHVKKRTLFITYVSLEGDVEANYFRSFEKLNDLTRQLLDRRTSLEPLCGDSAKDSKKAFVSNVEKLDYCSFVEDAKKKITDGEIFQIILSQRLEASFESDPFDLYRALRIINPSPYMYYLDIFVPRIPRGFFGHLPPQAADGTQMCSFSRGGFQIVGASPESQIRVENRHMLQRPLAGTRNRGATEEEDRRLETELCADEKEKAEHMMLVDLCRHDLGRVAEVGSVHFENLMHVERYSHVMHLTTDVLALLDSEKTVFDAFRASFPVGTVSGAPKIRAMELIDKYEQEKRGIYSGAVGYFDFRGNMDFAIAIRTMVCKDGRVFAQAGAGIVYDSDPEREYDECILKLMGSLAAVEMVGVGNDN